MMPKVPVLHLNTLEVDVSVGGGLDVFSVDHVLVDQSQPMGIQSTTRSGASTAVTPVGTAQMTVGLRPTESLAVFVGVGVDYDFAPPRYTYDRTVFEPWLVRPAVLVGLCIPLAGASACTRPEKRSTVNTK
jgi:hypothetical protein